MADLSQVSSADLQAADEGRLADISDEGLAILAELDLDVEGTSVADPEVIAREEILAAPGLPNVVGREISDPVRNIAAGIVKGTIGTATAIAEGIPKVVEELGKSKFEIAGGIGGGIGGGLVGSFGGPPGTFAGATAGGLAGSTAGQRLDIAAGTREDEPFLKSLQDAAVDEGVGIALSRIASPAAGSIISGVNRAARKAGLAPQVSRPYSEILLREADVFPTSQTPGVDIIQASENVLNERLLSFEEVGGRAGGPQIRRLLRDILGAQKGVIGGSAFVQRQNRIAQTVRRRLEAGPAPTPEQMRTGAIMSLEEVVEKAGKQLDQLERPLANARRKMVFNVPEASLDELEEVFVSNGVVEQAVGSRNAQRLRDVVKAKLVDAKGLPRSDISMAELSVLDKDIEAIIGEFKENKDVQKEIAGVYAAHIKPIIQGMGFNEALLRASKDGVPITEELSTFVTALDAQTRAAAIKKTLERQVGKIKKGGYESIYKSPEDFSEYMAGLFSAAQAAPEHAEVFMAQAQAARDYFKRSIVVPQMFKTTKTKPFDEISATGAVKLIDKYGEELISEVAGDEYLRMLKDTALIGRAMERTSGFVQPLTAANVNEDIARESARTALGSVFSRINLISAITDKTVRGVLFDRVPDKALLEALSGAEGQKIVERGIANPLLQPTGYNTYKQMFKLLIPFMDGDESAEPMSYGEYTSRIEDLVDERVGTLSFSEQE